MKLLKDIHELIDDRRGFRPALHDVAPEICDAACLIVSAFNRGGRLFICGNGGSAADSQHMAAELVGRFRRDREGLPAIALTTDTSALTAIANDWEYDYVFRRQLEALCNPDDVILGISTSGSSKSILNAMECARERALKTIGLVGGKDTRLEKLSDVIITVGGSTTAIIQERMLAVEHIICECIDTLMLKDG